MSPFRGVWAGNGPWLLTCRSMGCWDHHELINTLRFIYSAPCTVEQVKAGHRQEAGPGHLRKAKRDPRPEGRQAHAHTGQNHYINFYPDKRVTLNNETRWADWLRRCRRERWLFLE